jgi:predicted RND superfamily exporter protein
MDYCAGVKSDANREGCERMILDKVISSRTSFIDYQTAYKSYMSNKTTEKSNKLIDDYNTLTRLSQELKVLNDAYTSKYLPTNEDGSKDSQKFYDEIMSKYGKLLEMRGQLDQQIYDLYTNDYDSVYSNKSTVDSTVVTGVLWTLIVTLMLYYVIVKL